MDCSVGIVGDFDPENDLHRATGAALTRLGLTARWLPTDGAEVATPGGLDGFAGFWIAPSSPYRRMDGALGAIRFARERGVPLVGT